MAEVRIKADARNFQQGIRVSTQQAQKLSQVLTKTKAPLLHASETKKAVRANTQFARGLQQSARSYQQVNGKPGA